jgi:F420-non-reducing hydrogenase iron-sulfur subunit
MRLEYPASIKIIRVPCTGKVDVMYLLRAIQKGADGVYVVGCLEGACHYNEGNFRARERVNHVRAILEEIGLEAERVRMYNLSSGEGPTFAAFAREMTENIKALGPNPLKDLAKA